jgi:hypothetical protein
MTVENGGNAVSANHNPEPTAPRTREEMERVLTDFLTQAAAGEPAALATLRKQLRGPLGAPLVEAFGNLAAAAERACVEAAAGGNAAVREALGVKLAALRAELAGPDAAPLERLLAERVVLCWLQLHHADVYAAQADGGDIPWGDYQQRRQGRAQARYLAAVKALLTVRKLLRPAPSPLDLVSRPVEETTAPRRGRGVPAGEAAVEN